MAIENTLERIADALERIVAVQESTVSLRVPAGDFAAAVEASRNAPSAILAETQAALDALAADAPAPVEPTEPVVATEVVRKRGRPRKEDVVKREELQEKPATADAPPAPEAPEPEAPEAAENITLPRPENWPPKADNPPASVPDVKPEDVQKLILELVSKVGRGPVAAVLAGDPFKAARFGTIDVKHHGLLYQKLVELNTVDPMSL